MAGILPSIRLDIVLTEKQREMLALLKGPASRLLFPGGARSGKTFFIIWAIVMRALISPGSRHLICRKCFNHAKTYIWLDTLPKVLEHFPKEVYTMLEGDHYVKFTNGSELWIGGLDDKERVEKILGAEYATIYFNECSQIKWASVDMVLTRLSQKCAGIKPKAFFDLNPTGRGHWSYKIWIDGIDPETEKKHTKPWKYAYIFSTPFDNVQNLDENYIPDTLEDMTGNRRRRFLEGMYSDDDGNMVFPLGPDTLYTWKDFEEWKGKQKAPDLRCTAGLDLGFDDADAFCAIVYSETDPTRWLVYEAKERKQGVDALAGMVRAGLAFLAEHGLPAPPYIYTDSGGGGKRTMVDLSAAYGLPTAPAYKADKESGIRMLQEELRTGSLKIPQGGILAHEAGRTVWAEDDELGRRVIDDSQYHPDLVDSVLYAMRYIWYYYTKR